MNALEWKTVSIDDIKADEKSAIAIGPFGSRMKSDCYVETGIPVIRGTNLTGGRDFSGDFVFITGEKADELANCNVFYDDLVFPHRGAIGEVGIVRDKMRYVLSSSLMKLTCNKQIADPLFVYYFFKSARGHYELLKNSSQVGTPGIGQPLTSLKQVQLKLPPLSEQKAITAVLSAFDDKIELNRQMNATLEAMARALFKSWFIDFDPVRRNQAGQPSQPYDHLFPDRLKVEGNGREFPEGWRLETLKDILSLLETGDRPKGGVKDITEGVPSIGAESIVGLGVFDYGKTKYVPRKYFDSLKRGKVEDRDVLLYKDGGRPGLFEPHVTMFGSGFPFREYSINSHVYRMRAIQNVSQEYLYFWMDSEWATQEMKNRATGVAIPGINSTALRQIPILIPSNQIIAIFTEQVKPIIDQILANSNESRTLADLRDTLLPRLMSGQLRVPINQAFFTSSQNIFLRKGK